MLPQSDLLVLKLYRPSRKNAEKRETSIGPAGIETSSSGASTACDGSRPQSDLLVLKRRRRRSGGHARGALQSDLLVLKLNSDADVIRQLATSIGPAGIETHHREA